MPTLPWHPLTMQRRKCRPDNPAQAVSMSGTLCRSQYSTQNFAGHLRRCNSSRESVPVRIEAADIDSEARKTAADSASAADSAVGIVDFEAAAVETAGFAAPGGTDFGPAERAGPQYRNKCRTSIPTSAGRARCCISLDFRYSQP